MIASPLEWARSTAGIVLPLGLASLPLAACGGAATTDLFGAPPAATSTTSGTPTPAVDAGDGDPGSPAPSPGPPAPPLPSSDAGLVPVTIDATAPPADASVEGGLAAPTCALPGKVPALIDDGSWPGANATILPQCGRTGSWYVFNDGASKQSPPAGGPFGPFLFASPPSGATGYVRTWGTLSVASTGTQSKPHWGAGIGFDLADAPDGTARPYDLKAQGYAGGFSFWIRTGTSEALATIEFQTLTSNTSAYADGAYHGFSFPSPAAGTWTKVTVPFGALVQPAWTPPAERVPLDLTAVETLQWSFTSGGQQALGFDVAIGDVELW